MRRSRVDELLVVREQVDQQCAEAALAKEFRDEAIARAEAAASAAVREEHDAGRAARNEQVALERHAARADVDQAFIDDVHASFSPSSALRPLSLSTSLAPRSGERVAEGRVRGGAATIDAAHNVEGYVSGISGV